MIFLEETLPEDKQKDVEDETKLNDVDDNKKVTKHSPKTQEKSKNCVLQNHQNFIANL